MGNPDGNLIDNAISKKPQVVQIDPTDKSFKTDGCQPWQLTPDATVPANTPPPGVQGTLGILNGLLGGQNGPPTAAFLTGAGGPWRVSGSKSSSSAPASAD